MDFDIENISSLIYDKLGTWLNDIIRLLPNIVLAAIVLVLGLFLAKFFRNAIFKFLNRRQHSSTLINLFTSIIYFTAIGIVIFTVLSILNLDKAVTSILAGAGIAGLALAFAFQDIAANFISGVFITFRKPIRVGDIVKIKDYMGVVSEVNLRDTVMQTFRGQTVIIPNKEVTQNPIENYSHLQKRRFDLEVGVSYDADLEFVRETALQAVDGLEGISGSLKTTLFYTGFGDSSINFTLRMWLDSAEQMPYLEVGSRAIIAIKKAFDANDIVIPFPIRTLDMSLTTAANFGKA